MELNSFVAFHPGPYIKQYKSVVFLLIYFNRPRPKTKSTQCATSNQFDLKLDVLFIYHKLIKTTLIIQGMKLNSCVAFHQPQIQQHKSVMIFYVNDALFSLLVVSLYIFIVKPTEEVLFPHVMLSSVMYTSLLVGCRLFNIASYSFKNQLDTGHTESVSVIYILRTGRIALLSKNIFINLITVFSIGVKLIINVS